MKIFVKAKPGSKRERVERLDGLFGRPEEIHLSVAVKEPPIEGRANRAVLKAVAVYLKIPAGHLRLASGQTSHRKVFEVIP